MSTAVAERQSISEIAEQAMIQGDLARLTTEQRVSFYNSVCESCGLNPLTQPFAYITLNGKLTLYAKRDATDQLRKLHGVSVRIAKQQTIDGVHVVTATATDKTGRTDESTGAVSIGGLKGDALANALMKAETKAKRRLTLSICGLGLLDETELETIPNVQQIATPRPALNGKNDKPPGNLTDDRLKAGYDAALQGSQALQTWWKSLGKSTTPELKAKLDKTLKAIAKEIDESGDAYEPPTFESVVAE